MNTSGKAIISHSIVLSDTISATKAQSDIVPNYATCALSNIDLCRLSGIYEVYNIEIEPVSSIDNNIRVFSYFKNTEEYGYLNHIELFSMRRNTLDNNFIISNFWGPGENLELYINTLYEIHERLYGDIAKLYFG